jgi:hypothetical protein
MMAQIRDCGDGIRDGTYTMTAPKITGGTITGSTINNSAIGGTTAAAGKFTTLEATGVSTFSAGAVGTPAITTTGDTNTGIFFPAADTMRITSTGNVGIGVVPSAWSGATALQVGSGGAFFDFGSSNVVLGSNVFFNGTNNLYINTDSASYYQQSNGVHIWATAASGTAGNIISFSESMRIDSSGNVGIGTSSPTDKLTIAHADEKGITFKATGADGTTAAQLLFEDTNGGTGGVFRFDHDVNSFTFATAGTTERMRIDSSGNLLVGATSAATPTGVTSKFVSQGTFTGSTFGAAISSTAATGVDHYYISFQTATTTQRGYIYYNNGAGQVQLSATSDIRLKENIVDAPLALPILEQVKVRQYDWKETGNTNVGFIAQELYDVIPRAVAVGEDNEDGSIKRVWGVDNGTLVPYLVKAIQELKAELDSVKAELQTLKGN